MIATTRTLLEGAVDYAGLFPPAHLPMGDAVARYAAYRAAPHAWMLGRFVVPASRLDEFRVARDEVRGADGAPWRLSVIIEDAARDIAGVVAFNRQASKALADTIEVRASSVEEIARIAGAVGTHAVRAFVEVPITTDPEALINAIGTYGFGAKVRAGGVVSTAIPNADDVARFLAHCVRAKVPFKATAGLHHPLRGEYKLTYEADSPVAVMFGFLNVFLAAALLRTGATVREATALLEERDPGSLRIDATGIAWRDSFIPAAAIAELRRDALAGFGSCSFTEPVEETVALGFA